MIYVLIVSREWMKGKEGEKSTRRIHVFDDIYVCPYCGQTAVEQRVLQRGDSIYVESETYHRARRLYCSLTRK